MRRGETIAVGRWGGVQLAGPRSGLEGEPAGKAVGGRSPAPGDLAFKAADTRLGALANALDSWE